MIDKRFLKAPVVSMAVMLFMYLVGIAGHILQPIRPVMLILTPWILLVFAVVTLLFTLRSALRSRRTSNRILLWVAVTWLITFALEAIGVATGLVFGEYSYGLSLGPQIFDVPVIIGLNWTVIIFGLSEWCRVRRFPIWVSLLVVSAGAVVFDLVLEPVAISGLDYWTWQAPAVPLQNYIAWSVISLLFGALYFLLVPKNEEPVEDAGDGITVFFEQHYPIVYVIVQFVFIALLNLSLPLMFP